MSRRLILSFHKAAGDRRHQPRWVVGGWPRPKSMRRAALQDGWLPAAVGAELAPDLLTQGVERIRKERQAHGLTMDGYDVVAEGTTAVGDPKAADTVRPWADAGATWWIDADWSSMDRTVARQNAERRLAAGPPRVD
jgi:hypothetical protein